MPLAKSEEGDELEAGADSEQRLNNAPDFHVETEEDYINRSERLQDKLHKLIVKSVVFTFPQIVSVSLLLILIKEKIMEPASFNIFLLLLPATVFMLSPYIAEAMDFLVGSEDEKDPK
jgi:hypothetical protein